MAYPQNHFPTRAGRGIDFAQGMTPAALGAPAHRAEVAELIRDGKIKARKEGGKWMIPQSQLSSKWVKARAKPAAPKAKASKPGAKTPAVRGAARRVPRRRRLRLGRCTRAGAAAARRGEPAPSPSSRP
ncbi:MAG: helix-turn-helix domain-containing protein [Desulfomicrobium escambiense]|nr:helix-turn-helix domain-containing protein [Desulfomicrobium escambiense]